MINNSIKHSGFLPQKGDLKKIGLFHRDLGIVLYKRIATKQLI